MVLQDHCPDLLHLVRFGFGTVSLQVDLLFDASASENVVATPSSFSEAKP